MAVDAQIEQKNKNGCCGDSEELSVEEMLAQVDKIIDTFSNVEGALIPILQTAQNSFGYLPEAVLKKISASLKIPYSEVAGVVSFYSYFST
ncbi:MAG: NAD(P)H-dependent oxidoreductase subunit E, partial [Sediminispirochaetaceae bacterium]